MPRDYNVYGLGNAIFDTEIQVDDQLLDDHQLAKGLMTLVAEEEQQNLLEKLRDHPQHDAAGGSAANTMVGLVQFGATACYSGKVGADSAGARYKASMLAAGVHFDAECTTDNVTGRCLVLITNDGERTMRTALGAAAQFSSSDVDFRLIESSQILYIEGYLFTSDLGTEAAIQAMGRAKSTNTLVALSLSDAAVLSIFHDRFTSSVRDFADIGFCNEQEARVYSGQDTTSDAVAKLSQDVATAFVTCGSDGSIVMSDGGLTSIPSYSVPVVDTTGAGDIYAAGALFGLTHDIGPKKAGILGSFASARIVQQLGPRLSEPLRHQISAILEGAKP